MRSGALARWASPCSNGQTLTTAWGALARLDEPGRAESYRALDISYVAGAKLTANVIYERDPGLRLMQGNTELRDDPATRRLYYLASRLDTAGTVIDQWKLPLATAEAPVAGGGSG